MPCACVRVCTHAQGGAGCLVHWAITPRARWEEDGTDPFLIRESENTLHDSFLILMNIIILQRGAFLLEVCSLHTEHKPWNFDTTSAKYYIMFMRMRKESCKVLSFPLVHECCIVWCNFTASVLCLWVGDAYKVLSGLFCWRYNKCLWISNRIWSEELDVGMTHHEKFLIFIATWN